VEHTEATRAMMANSGIPVVEVMDVDGDPVDAAVGISHWRAGFEMGQEIVARGYRRIGMMTTAKWGDHRARKRREGLTQALNQAGVGLADQMEYEGSSGFAKGREMTVDMLARNTDIDFLYYSNDLTAAGGLLYCLEKGCDVGGNLGLAGFNGFNMVAGLPKRLATTDSCRNETGRVAAQIVAEQYDFEAVSDKRVELSPTILPGETMRPKP